MTADPTHLLIGDDPCLDAVAARLAVDSVQSTHARSVDVSEIRSHDFIVLVAPDVRDGWTLEGEVIGAFLSDVMRCARELRHRDSTRHASLVVVTTRDVLGWAARPWTAGLAGALVALARSLALDLAPLGHRVNVVAKVDSYDNPQPVGLAGPPVGPDDVARSVLFFLDPRNTYITGQVVFCTGGAHLLSSMSA